MRMTSSRQIASDCIADSFQGRRLGFSERSSNCLLDSGCGILAYSNEVGLDSELTRSDKIELGNELPLSEETEVGLDSELTRINKVGLSDELRLSEEAECCDLPWPPKLPLSLCVSSAAAVSRTSKRFLSGQP